MAMTLKAIITSIMAMTSKSQKKLQKNFVDPRRMDAF